MRKWGIALALTASVCGSACVQTRQYADVQFTPPQGDYKLLVMRPDVTVGSVTTGGMVEPRADWTEQARTNIIAALARAAGGARRQDRDPRAPQPASRSQRPGRRRSRAAVLRSRPVDRASQISRRLSADQARQGPRLDARRGRRPARPEDRLRLCLVHARRGQLRLDRPDRFAGARVAGCFVGFCAPNVGGAAQFAYARLVDLHTGEVVWFNVVQAGSQIAGIKFGDIRTPQGAEQMVERLLGRMKPGRAVRRAAEQR